MDDEQRKEIELLLENTEKNNDNKFKKEKVQIVRTNKLRYYVRLVIPHVALVLVVCIYAMVGAFIFHAIESPHEDKMRQDGVAKINKYRLELVDLVWRRSYTDPVTQEEWVREMSKTLENFNQNLYRAYKDQYVRYGDIRTSKAEPRAKRHRSSSKSRSESGGKLWTSTSSLFFAATTMATIGYGNVVPVTMKGRLFCVAFALFGAPLAIITIGDLGKFLSECTIWLYKKMLDGKKWFKDTVSRLVAPKGNFNSESDVEGGNSERNENIDWEEFDRTEVPVFLVFVILLLYIAFGGVLFSYIESWTYMDAFYYCFVSLTTIGFGDLVPERHEYIVLMLVYLGVGLAVTTMCIDLVGIKYIQKIHYFGRKFRGTDILQMLKRKRMIERKLAMGNTEDVMQIIHQVVQEQQKEIQQARPPPKMAALLLQNAEEAWQHDKEEKTSLQLDDDVISWKADETLAEVTANNIGLAVNNSDVLEDSTIEMMNLPDQTHTLHSTDVEELEANYATAIPRPETPLSNSSESGRNWMYDDWHGKEDRQGSDVSGPALSDKCSIHTSPSIHERERMFDRDVSPQGSVLSFKFAFDGPWPNLKEIAGNAKAARRQVSCPGDIERPVSPTLYNAIQGTEYFMSQSCSSLSSNPAAITCIEDWVSYVQLLDDVQQPLSRVRSPIYHFVDVLYPFTELPHEPFEWPDTGPDVQVLSPVFPADVTPPPLHSPLQSFTLSDVHAMSQASAQEAKTEGQVQIQCISVMRNPVPVLTIQNEPESPLNAESSSSSSFTTSPLFDIDLGGFELVDSGLSAEALLSHDDPVIYHRDMPVHSVHHDTVQTEAALENLMNAPDSMLSNSVPPAMVADNYCFIVDGDKIKMGDIMGDDQWWRHTSRPTKYFFSEDLRKFYRVNCITAKGKIISARLATTTPMAGGAGLGMPPNQQGPSTSSSLPTTAAASSATTPRSSMSVTNRNQRGEKMPLEHVYKVTRFYSFWKTCTSFHRIVTMIDKIEPADRNDNFKADFKRRLFVQYLWRNAKPSDKARVQKEFDPRRQRLLKFVTSPAERKKVMSQIQQNQPWRRER